MKQKIFMYLFVFSILIVLFQYMNSKHTFKDMDHKLGSYKTLAQKYKDSVVVLGNEISELSHFNFNRNEDAVSYFENEGFTPDEIAALVKNKLYETNEVKGQHPIVPYAAREGKKIMINTVKMLNHKWIIADFSDGEYWGEVFLTYEVSSKKEVTFNLVESFLYPFD